jgi:hypothetical protein
METRVFLAISMAMMALLTGTACLLAIRVDLPLSTHPEFNEMFYATLACSLFFLGVTTLFSHCGGSNASPRLPQRVYILPVTTKLLVTAYLGYRVALIAIFAAIWLAVAWLLRLDLDDAFATVLMTVLFFPVVQALVWLMERRHWYWLAAGAFALTIGARFITPWLDAAGPWVVVGTVVALALLLPIPLARLGLSIDRHRVGRRGLNPFEGILPQFGSRREVFKSPAQAQRWFEFRTKGVALIVCFLILEIGFTLFALAQGATMSELIRTSWGLLIMAALVAGAIMPVYEHRLRREGAAAFVWIHPVSTRAIVRSRLFALAQSMALCVGLLFIMTLVLSGGLNDKSLYSINYSLSVYFSPLAIAGIYVAYLLAISLFAWSILNAFYGCFAFVLLFSVVSETVNPLTPAATATVFTLMLGLFALPVLWATWCSAKLGLVGTREFGVMAMLTGAGLAAMMIFYSLNSEQPWLALATAPVILFAIEPFCVMPLLHHRARHR